MNPLKYIIIPHLLQLVGLPTRLSVRLAVRERAPCVGEWVGGECARVRACAYGSV